ncbi:heterocyst frequency control protein PatD [Myxacorys almedinensis]|uniref:Heterocyst frequency control protein PatD n=1 Tax=Myxacorys almedinensis A TaxID=2690445 RepID=A0A8J7YXC1_9CYAN|nr:heterocyst frequency control protein PatD [Myxacorys almedinensis]NDJ16319.1 heterocyst frequency control protein PatD [Myxacorys almedinensis A]
MIPEFHRSIYQSFKGDVEQFQTRLLQVESTPGEAREDTASTDLSVRLSALQTKFEIDICPLDLDQISDREAQQIRSIWVEIDKQLRLLRVDIGYIKTAKQPETMQRRLEQVKGRLERLIAYSERLLD